MNETANRARNPSLSLDHVTPTTWRALRDARYSVALNDARRLLRAVPADLRHHVDGVFTYRNQRNGWCSEITPADEGTNLVVQLAASHPPLLFLCGPEPMYRRLSGPPDVCWVGIRLRPGATTALFGVEGREVAGGLLMVEDLLPHDHRELVGRLGDDDNALGIVFDFVRARERRARPSAMVERVHAAVGLLTRAQPLGLDDAVRALGTSPRSFRREFGHLVGIGPKRFSRVVRLRRAARRLGAARSLATLALEAGFSDQAHMTREFVSLIGLAPGEVRQAVLPFVPGANGSVVE